MPKPLSVEGTAALSALVNGRDMTAKVRTLADAISDATESVNAQDWSEDLQGIGFEIDADNSESVCKSLAGAFSTVAREATGNKLAARVTYIATTGEVSVAFRTVKPRASK